MTEATYPSMDSTGRGLGVGGGEVGILPGDSVVVPGSADELEAPE